METQSPVQALAQAFQDLSSESWELLYHDVAGNEFQHKNGTKLKLAYVLMYGKLARNSQLILQWENEAALFSPFNLFQTQKGWRLGSDFEELGALTDYRPFKDIKKEKDLAWSLKNLDLAFGEAAIASIGTATAPFLLALRDSLQAGGTHWLDLDNMKVGSRRGAEFIEAVEEDGPGAFDAALDLLEHVRRFNGHKFSSITTFPLANLESIHQWLELENSTEQRAKLIPIPDSDPEA